MRGPRAIQGMELTTVARLPIPRRSGVISNPTTARETPSAIPAAKPLTASQMVARPARRRISLSSERDSITAVKGGQPLPKASACPTNSQPTRRTSTPATPRAAERQPDTTPARDC